MTVAVIGGSGFARWDRFHVTESFEVDTPYAPRPVRLFRGVLGECEIVFIPRHGSDHSLPPHRINYRANIRALKEAGVNTVLATATVGGISHAAAPGSLLIPDQILDYTYGRAHTFFDGEDEAVGHVDMTEPYCEALRNHLLAAARQTGISVVAKGTYAATQGPRFETSAEIDRLERDGADVVGMTGMPEAALAKELQIAYAAMAIVVNPAAGRAAGAISMDTIRRWSAAGRSTAEVLLEAAVPNIREDVFPVPPPLTP
jgi:5'-methylthioadenosine phosphorylase/5'-methylthioinosine phosphorylase